MNFIAFNIVILTVVSIHLIQKTNNIFLKKVFNWFPPILFAYVIPAIITHLFKLDLSLSAVHSISKEFIIPLAIISVMSAMSFTQLKIVGIKPLILFVSGSFIIAILPVVLVFFTKFFDNYFYETIINQEVWKGLTTIVGSWIGGSTSQLVLKEVVQCPEELFASVLVLDNILVNIWTIIMFQGIKRSDHINSILKITDTKPTFIKKIETNKEDQSSLFTFFIVFLISLTSFFLKISFLYKIIILSIIGLIIGNFIRNWSHSFVLKIGGLLILTIMSILGLKLNFTSLYIPTSMIILTLIWLVLHYAGMIVIAWKFNIHAAWIPIASMANLGGISTAPAVTAAYEKRWMPHAILLSILSMVSGTFWGLLTIFLFGIIL
tara:strand:- start:7128 stop:8261 length:1134 start_codon:yes stop_codon:yes gene_type:complete